RKPTSPSQAGRPRKIETAEGRPTMGRTAKRRAFRIIRPWQRLDNRSIIVSREGTGDTRLVTCRLRPPVAKRDVGHSIRTSPGAAFRTAPPPHPARGGEAPRAP